MDSLFFHPKVVHIPIALAVLMPLIAGGLTLAWWRGWLPRRTWVIAAALQALLVGSGFFAMRMGEESEERVEKVVSERLIHEHEEAAETFVWTAAGVLVLVLLAAAIPRERAALGLAAAATLGTVVVLVLGARTGEAGGALVYEHGAASAYVTGSGGAAPPVGAEEPDDDDD
ncbi:MAG: hypothetical protein H6744_21235 [Deltaproteobacteria bacterium]|nr:hypothetical protein [Deltaproteobacteria bacterium]